MTRITRFALGHRALIVLFWLATAITGAMTAGLTTSRMTNSFSMPGQAITTDARIVVRVRQLSAGPACDCGHGSCLASASQPRV